MRRGLVLALLAFAACRATLPDTKLAALDAVLAAKDDNDPRLDTAFEGLSESAKRSFRARFADYPREYFNERGTIVYVLGRNMKTPADWAFFRAVVAEPPCRSLADCAKAGEAGGPGDEVTLAYPALVALKRAQREFSTGGSMQAAARTVVREALKSEAPAVRRLAERGPGR
ncbi:hypothetical protein EPO15_13420 [bacterium]|nr:MAG: hypothetical protein EPO15_13420 [bacterium]